MKTMIKILSRYVLSAAAVAIFLLIINFTVLAAWLFQSAREYGKNYTINQMADGLTLSNGKFSLSGPIATELDQHQQWAMLIDGKGSVIWNRNLPSDVPLTYTLTDVAGLSRWYLRDYPVKVWQYRNGLFVVGDPKNSMWKIGLELPMKTMDNSRFWVPLFLILNLVTAVILALLFGLRLFLSLKKLTTGIEDLAQMKPVSLPSQGILGDLASGINHASAQLIRQETALNKRDNARTTWIAGISHDIRTPLSVIMGYAGQMEEDKALTREQQELAVIIRSQCQKIKALINDLNLASKLEYDMQPIRKEEIHLTPLIRSLAADVLNSRISDKHTLDILIDENAQNIIINGDSQLIRRAITNLIINSMKHNPDGCDIKIRISSGSKTALLSVTDNGSGFPPQTLERLNQPLEPMELDNHGLGLTIVRQIINVHGGTASFTNPAGSGCRVILTLPVLPL